jgi:hypothetical protein
VLTRRRTTTKIGHVDNKQVLGPEQCCQLLANFYVQIIQKLRPLGKNSAVYNRFTKRLIPVPVFTIVLFKASPIKILR